MPITNPNIRLINKKKADRRNKYGNSLFNVFSNQYEITNLKNTKKKTEENIKKLEMIKSYYSAKEKYDKKEYDNVNKKIEKRLEALRSFDDTIHNSMALYVNLPLSLVLQSNSITMKKNSSEVNFTKEDIICELNQICDYDMDEKIKTNVINTTYNITESLIDTLDEYRSKKNEIERDLERKLKGSAKIENIPSSWITIGAKAIQMGLVSLGALEVSTMEQLNNLTENMSMSAKTFLITAGAIALYEFIDKQGKKVLKFCHRLLFKRSTKKNLNKLKESYVMKKNEILNSLYDTLRETVQLHLATTIKVLRNKKIISEKEKVEYESMMLKNSVNDKKIIDNISSTIEKIEKI